MKDSMCTGLRIKTLVYALVFCATSMVCMLIFADHKAITIANVAQDQVVSEETFQTGNPDEAARPLRFRQGEEDTAYLCIPLEMGIKAENVTMENHYMEKEMWIYIAGATPDYYEKEAVSGNISRIEAGCYEYSGDKVLIKFSLNGVYECKSVLEESKLYIEFVPPWEVYEKIVVIDAAGGGEDAGIQSNGLVEKDVTLDIVKRLKLLLEKTDVKVYYTRTEDVDISAESRVALANAVRADLFISIGLNESGNVADYGTEAIYNEAYFIPKFGNVELADLVERQVVTGVSGRGNGLYAAEDSDILLQEAKVPSTIIKVGYASNSREAELLKSGDYRDKIAMGLYDAIVEAGR
ncbi:MAG: N-acetylmuramoyl-L-alanine amidase [Lachnospiraceae bacterium]